MKRSFGYLALLLSMVIFGLNFISIKYVSYYIEPVTLVFLRFLLGTIFLHGIVRVLKIKVVLREDWKKYVVTSLLGIVIYYLFQVNACAYLTGSEMALICATIPVITVLVERLIFKFDVHWSTYLLFGLSMWGVYLVLDVPLDQFLRSEKVIGVILMLGTVTSWVAYTFATKSLQHKVSSLVMFYKQSVYASAMLLPLSLIDSKLTYELVLSSNNMVPIFWNMLFLGFVCSALGYYFYLYGMEKIGLKLSSLYMNLIPVVAAVASYYILNEEMSATKIFGMVVVLSAIILVNVINGNHKKASKPKKKVA